MNHATKNRGFTIVELTLAMAFVSLLLLAVTMTVIQISNIYNRGLTLKEVNQAGSAIEAELKRTISNTQPFDIDKSYINNESGGRLCTGQYSFIWNYGDSSANKYSGRNQKTIKFVKVSDPGSTYCLPPANGNKLKDISFSESTELLDIGEHSLALHSFTVAEYDTSHDGATGQRLYSFKFVLGTNGNFSIDKKTNSCKTPDQTGGDAIYCYIDQFDFTVRSGSNDN